MNVLGFLSCMNTCFPLGRTAIIIAYFFKLIVIELSEKNSTNGRIVKKVFFDRAVRTVCNEAGLNGSGLKDYMTNHVLRSSITSLLVEPGPCDINIILRTGHSTTPTLARYNNIRGAEGFRQQERLLQSTSNNNLRSSD